MPQTVSFSANFIRSPIIESAIIWFDITAWTLATSAQFELFCTMHFRNLFFAHEFVASDDERLRFFVIFWNPEVTNKAIQTLNRERLLQTRKINRVPNFLRALTAGRAKKEIAKTEKQEATILPIHVFGTASPYPMVVTVIWEGGGVRRSDLCGQDGVFEHGANLADGQCHIIN